MRTEDILNNFEYKTIKKKLRNEFPFIVDIRPIKNHNEYTSLLFFDVVVDINKFLDQMNAKLSKKDKRLWEWIRDSEGFVTISSVYLSVEETEIRDLEKKILNVMHKIHKSPALPEEFKLPMKPDLSRLLASGEVEDRFVDNPPE